MTSLRHRIGTTARLLTRALPDRVLVQIFPKKYAWDPDEMTVAMPPAGRVRLYVGPVNSAGQGFAWARAAQEHLPGVGAVSLMTRDASTDRYRFDVDVAIPVMGYTFASRWQRQQREQLESGFTHVLLESGRFAYGSIPFRTPLSVASDLERAGVRVALLWHGSDIRVPSLHAAVEPDSPFGTDGGYPRNSVTILERNASTHRRMVEESTFPVFVSTPGLLDVPRSRWLPVVVDTDRWVGTGTPLERDRPVVTYVPSNSPMKGAASIDEQLTQLDAEGIVEYRRLGGIPAAEMPAVYGDADIVLDQFRLGDYGVAACEAMAAGRVVVGHVSDAVRDRVLAETGRRLPIVEARIGDVGDVVRRILSERDHHRTIAADAAEFVKAVHDGRASAEALAGFLGAQTDGDA